MNPWNLDALKEIEIETGKKIYNILQLRVHPAIIELKQKIQTNPKQKKYDIDLTYITSRGNWYFTSWKGDIEKSGGIATNIGIHFFDMLIWLFGAVEHQEVHLSSERKMSGYLELKHANVRWFLFVDRNDLPYEIVKSKRSTHRSITIDGNEIEFSGGFTDLHTTIYQDILKGRGFGIEDSRPATDLVYDIRQTRPKSAGSDYLHPILWELSN